MSEGTSLELREAAIEAVRNQAHLALSDQYLDTTKTLPLWLGAGLGALVFMGNLGTIGVGVLFVGERLFAYRTYARKRAQLAATSSAKTIIEPLRRTPSEYAYAKSILQAEGDLGKVITGGGEHGNGTPPTIDVAGMAVAEPSPNSSLQREVPISWVPKALGQGEHLALIGLSGASKTTTLLKACDGITAPILYLTTKDADQTPPDWEAYKLTKTAGAYYLGQLAFVCDRLEELLTGSVQHHLIVDEALQQIDQAKDSERLPEGKPYKGTANRFESVVKCYIRSGRGDGQLIAAVSQSPNGTDLFGSAKTMQGLKLILCAGEYSSNKFQFFPAWAKQLFGHLITPDITAQLQTINSGFWHLTNTGDGLALNQTRQSNVATVPCQECPIVAGDGGEMPEKPVGPSPMRVKAEQFIAEHELPSKAAWEQGQTRGAIAYAYCALLQDALASEVPLAGFSGNSRFVKRLYTAQVIQSRSRDEWWPHLQELIDKGYLKADSNKLWLD
ncbi:MAG: hypothetical protein F6K00_34940 [Leptolyngbya sp. SIOISBB]|nr:hypothetical protein [Leptolyngbya sp. SIOISBB]